MKNKNKKPLVALLLVAVLGLVGGTVAYFTSKDVFENTFGTKVYKMEVKETFESPSDWVPGTTTNKTVIATNKESVEAAVRVSYTEEWKDSAGGSLSLTDGNGQKAALINFADDLATKWTTKQESDGKTYYYYKTKLAKDQSTSSFIKSVTFNPNVTISYDKPECTVTGNTKTCTTTSTGYAGGTYKLYITVETVQYSAYKQVWNTDVVIS